MIYSTDLSPNNPDIIEVKQGERRYMTFDIFKNLFFLSCLILCSLLLGCGHVTNVNLLYDTQLQPVSTEGKNTKIYLVKPVLGEFEWALRNRLPDKKFVLGLFHLEYNGVDSPNSIHVDIFSSNIMHIDKMNGYNPINITTYTNDSPADWISGALGSELKARGYDVEYVTSVPDVDNLVLSLTINKCKADIFYQVADSNFSLLHKTRITMRSTVDIGIEISKNKKVLYRFTAKDGQGLDESEFDKCVGFLSIDPYNESRMAACHSNIMKTTLHNTLVRAVKTLLDIREENNL